MLFSVLFLVGQAAAQGRGLTFKEEKLVVKIPKPELQILITKQNLTPRYDLELRESFLPKIVEAVQHKPF